MAVPSTNIKMSQIRTELGSSSYSLKTLSELAGKSGQHAMSEFANYTHIKWQFNVTAQDSDHNIYNLGYDVFCIGKSCSQYDRLGYSTYGDRTSPGNSVTHNYGSTTDTTCDFKSGAVLKKLIWEDLFYPDLTLELAGSQTNAGFTTMTIGSSSFSRSSATHTIGTNGRLNTTTTTWTWNTANMSTSGGGNPFPYTYTINSYGSIIYSPTGASTTVTFT